MAAYTIVLWKLKKKKKKIMAAEMKILNKENQAGK